MLFERPDVQARVTRAPRPFAEELWRKLRRYTLPLSTAGKKLRIRIREESASGCVAWLSVRSEVLRA